MKTIHEAACTGDAKAIRACLAKGIPVDQPEKENGLTALAIGCKSPAAGVDVLQLLIEAGADPGARFQKESPSFPVDPATLLDNAELPPETRKLLEASQALLKNYSSDVPPLIVAVVPDIGAEKLRFLIGLSIDLNARSSSGSTAFFHAANHDRLDLMEILLAAGASPDGVTSYGESAIRSFSRTGKFERVAWLLSIGADPAPLGWNALHHAVALGSIAEVSRLITGGANLEERDSWERTAFLLAVHTGDREKAALLLEKGADPFARGRCGRTVMSYTTSRDDVPMLQWLLEWGFNPGETNDFGETPFINAVSHNAVECCRVLLDAGVDWQQAAHRGSTPINNASRPEIIRLLLERGANLAELEPEARRAFIGLETTEDLEATADDYRAGRSRRFGRSNPARMEIPYWNAMVRCGWDTYRARKKFKGASTSYGGPYWTYDRFGMSLTLLPDGRFIQIGGEHEDSYDPDFCIYNDVFIHDGKGGFEILGYPEIIFPPTDFHSATLVGKWIYIIGNLGYTAASERHEGRTPVYRFQIHTGAIEQVMTSGDDPGWIYSHQASLEGDRIRISGGKIYRALPTGKGRSEKHTASYWFHPAKGVWTRIDPANA